MTQIITKESIIKDLTIKRLEKIFTRSRHLTLLEKMTSGHIFDQYVDLTTKEVSLMNANGMSQRYLAIFVDESAKKYAETYLNGMNITMKVKD